MMMLYHIFVEYLDIDGKTRTVMRFNIEEKIVKEQIAIPYMKNQPFFLGRSIKPSKIIRIYIFKSEEDFTKLTFPDKRKIIRGDTRSIVNAFHRGSIKGVEECTSKFITSAPEDDVTRTRIHLNKDVETKPLSKDIFIVHGSDLFHVEELKIMLEDFGLNPIILHEQVSGGLTIVEKLEKYAENVGYAFVILTPDDRLWYHVVYRGLRATEEQAIFRARQNVILEFGYFMGLLGRDKVCCLYKGNVELPSDMHGIVYNSFNDSVFEQRSMIMKELKEAGYKIKKDAIVDSTHVLEISNAKMEVINGALKVTFDIKNNGESNLLSLSVFGVIFDKNDTKTSAESTESLGKLPKGKMVPIIQQFNNYDSTFETLTIIIKNDEEILTQELKIDEYLKI